MNLKVFKFRKSVANHLIKLCVNACGAKLKEKLKLYVHKCHDTLSFGHAHKLQTKKDKTMMCIRSASSPTAACSLSLDTYELLLHL